MSKTATRQPGAVLYTRVSTGEQVEHGTSLATQLEACRMKALALGLPIVSEYEDAGVSGGFLTSRTGMMSAISDLQQGRGNVLICANISRFSRDAEHQQALLKSVRAANARLIFCDMTLEDTPTGDMMFGMLGQFAQWERATIKTRTYGGHTERAAQGVQTGRATSPFGLYISKKDDVIRGTHRPEQLGKYLIVEGKAEVVQDLFARYDSGTASLNDLSRMMNASGIPTPGGGAMWRASNIRYILTNPVYKGVASFGRFDHDTDEARLSQADPRTGLPRTSPKNMRPADPETWITWSVPALVSEEQWERVQERLTVNKAHKGGAPAHVRMLAGRVNCPICGAGMFCAAPTKKQSKKDPAVTFTYPHRYQCGHYRRTLMDKGSAECAPTGYYVSEVEASVVLAVATAEEHPEWVTAAMTTYTEPFPAQATGADTARELAQVEKALKQLEARQTATVQAQIAGIMSGAPADAYNAVFAQIAGEREGLEARRVSLARVTSARQGGGAMAEPVDLARVLADTRRVLTSEFVSGPEKRDALGLIIERVICQKQEDGHAGADVVFLPGLFGATSLQTRRGYSGMERGTGRRPACSGLFRLPPRVQSLRN